MTSQRVERSIGSKHSPLVAPLVSRRHLLAIAILTRLVCAAEALHYRYFSKIVVRITFIVFEFSLRENREKLGDRSFKCLICTVLEHYLILTGCYTILENFLENTLEPLLDSDPEACSCFIRLQEFALRNAQASFLYELKYTHSREEAVKLALWFHDRIVHKVKKQKRGTLVDNEFAVVLIGPEHLKNSCMYRTLNFVQYAISKRKVKRIHVLATGNSILLARRFENILLIALGLEKKFDVISAVIGETAPKIGLSITYET